MTETSKKNQNEYLLKLLERHDPKLLIPQLRIQNQWEINGGVKVIFLYVRHPTPLFRLKILYECLKDYLEKNGVSKNETTLVGKELHRYEPKPVLLLKKFKMNPRFVTGKCRNLYAWRLTLRASWVGVTICFWTRACCLYIFQNHELSNPHQFLNKFLGEIIEYPEYVIKDYLHKNKLKEIVWELNTSRDIRKGNFRLVL